MRAINHAMTGAIIGFAVGEPFIAVPAAVASHFVLDAIPHFGERHPSFTSPTFKALLVFDFFMCAGLVLILALAGPKHWLLACFCALAAAGVDFMHVPKYLKTLKTGVIQIAHDPIGRFHAVVQWFERPPGALVELAWAAACVIVLTVYVK